MRVVALIINTDKPLAVRSGLELLTWLEARGIEPLLQPETARVIGRPDLAATPTHTWADASVLMVLGGDGTLIRAAQLAAPLRLPVLGINTGHLGFLTEIESGELFDGLEQILEDQYQVEERLMLHARVIREGSKVLEVTALNDAVISKGPRARLVHLDVSVDDTSIAQYRADGVIIATPTGSTAYSLSAGGPVVGPTVDVLLITPICPHTINSRAMVISGESRVAVTVVENPGEVGLSADGSDPFPLLVGDVVEISRAPFTARLVRRNTYRFYDVLRQKLADSPR